MSRQPPAASDRASGQSGRPSVTASTSAADTMSGAWLIAATARSWATGSSRTGCAPGAGRGARPDPRRTARPWRPDRPPRAGRRTVRPRPRRSRCVAAGHRVAADEAQAEPIGPLHDGDLRARDVGDRRAGRKGSGERAGELVEQVEALERRRGQDDEVGPVDGLTERRRGSPDDAIGERHPGARGRPAPGGQVDRSSEARGGSRSSQRTSDRSADEPEPDDRDPHAADHRRSGSARPRPGHADSGLPTRARPRAATGPWARR